MNRSFILIIIITLSIYNCRQKTSDNDITKPHKSSELKKSTKELSTNSTYSIPKVNCTSQELTITHRYAYGKSENHWNRKITLPVKGKFVEESHYVTNMDKFKGNRLFANNKTENIDDHLERSYELYKKYDPEMTFDKLFRSSWNKVWTPAESGKIGQGSVGEIQTKKLTPEMEMWFLTMMWASGEKPKIGTKFLLQANNKSVIVITGFETGPGQKKFIGGITREVHAWLKTNNSSEIKISYLKNQDLPIGPVLCD